MKSLMPRANNNGPFLCRSNGVLVMLTAATTRRSVIQAVLFLCKQK